MQPESSTKLVLPQSLADKPLPYTDIHPLVAKERFGSSINYELIKPSASLASAILTTVESDRFFRTIFFGTDRAVRFISKDAATPAHPLYVVEGPRQYSNLPDSDRVEVQKKLNKLADQVTFHLRPDMCLKNARTEPDSTRPGHSSIFIAEQFYRWLADADLSKIRAHNRQIWMTFIILHELAHAANYCAVGYNTNYPEDPFFEDGLIGELGFEYHARLFGVVPDAWHPAQVLKYSTAENPLDNKDPHWIQWPWLKDLGKETSRKSTRPAEDTKREWWLIRDQYVQTLFDPATWINTSEQSKREILVPLALITTIKKCLEDSLPMPVPDSVADIFRKPNTQTAKPMTYSSIASTTLTALKARCTPDR